MDPEPRPDKYLRLEYRPGHIAVMTIRTFFNGFLQQTHEDFAGFLAASFQALQDSGVKKLIIDVRNNQGGNDENGELLYAYLTQRPFRYYASQETVTEQRTESDHPNLRVQSPQKNNFKGKVFILTNGRSFSATAEFAAIARSNKRGLFIGEEAGGGYLGNTSGDDITVTLPYSKISVRIPLVKYTLAVAHTGHDDHGVLPDYPVTPTISDFLSHNDVQLIKALALAGR